MIFYIPTFENPKDRIVSLLNYQCWLIIFDIWYSYLNVVICGIFTKVMQTGSVMQREMKK